MARYIQKLSFGIDQIEWWVGWEIEGPPRAIEGLVPADAMSPDELQRLGVAAFQRVTPDLLSRMERRHVQRVRLKQPWSGRVGAIAVLVVDLSTGGAGIAHEHPLQPGRVIQLDFSDGTTLYSLGFEVLRCQLSRGFIAHGDARYYSSLKLRPRTSEDRRILTGVVAALVTSSEVAIRENPGDALALL